MGFYYGSNAPPPEDKSGGFRETITIIWVVFKVLALPLGILLGVVLGLVLLFYLFVLSPFLGFGAIAVILIALVARGVWEARHPPELR